MFGLEFLEYKAAVESRLDRIEEMLRLALFNLKRGETDTEKYACEKIEKAGCGDVPVSEMCSGDELNMLMEYGEEHKNLSILYASAIGFSNGVEWSRKNN